MTDSAETTPAPAPPAPSGLKVKVQGAMLKGFLKLPPPAQQKVMTVAMKVGPVVAKAAPHKNKILAGTGAVVVLRRLRNR